MRIFDWKPGAWQQNTAPQVSTETVMASHAVYACVTLIAADFGKLPPRLMQFGDDRIWSETESAAFSPFLKKPNRFQNRIQFQEWWATSKLMNGNVYALKERDARGVVVAEYILDPCRVTPLVTDSAEVYYQIGQDNMAGLPAQIIVPASEIVHDRMNCLFHPLVGISPLFACAAAANTGLQITNNSAKFFTNNSNPGGVLIAPGAISNETALRLKTYWEENYTGDNAGKVAVLGDNLKYEAMRMSAADSQLIEQLRWTAEVVCSVFHMPPFKVGLGATPTYANAEVLNQIYYSDCLQSHIEQYELCQDEGLGLDRAKDGKRYGIELDTTALFRMDTATQHKVLQDDIKGGLLTPNEARMAINRKPLEGGDTIYLQQQYYSMAALAQRDQDDPFASPEPAPILPAPNVTDGEEDAGDDQVKALTDAFLAAWHAEPLEISAHA